MLWMSRQDLSGQLTTSDLPGAEIKVKEFRGRLSRKRIQVSVEIFPFLLLIFVWKCIEAMLEGRRALELGDEIRGWRRK